MSTSLTRTGRRFLLVVGLSLFLGTLVIESTCDTDEVAGQSAADCVAYGQAQAGFDCCWWEGEGGLCLLVGSGPADAFCVSEPVSPPTTPAPVVVIGDYCYCADTEGIEVEEGATLSPTPSPTTATPTKKPGSATGSGVGDCLCNKGDGFGVRKLFLRYEGDEDVLQIQVLYNGKDWDLELLGCRQDGTLAAPITKGFEFECEMDTNIDSKFANECGFIITKINPDPGGQPPTIVRDCQFHTSCSSDIVGLYAGDRGSSKNGACLELYCVGWIDSDPNTGLCHDGFYACPCDRPTPGPTPVPSPQPSPQPSSQPSPQPTHTPVTQAPTGAPVTASPTMVCTDITESPVVCQSEAQCCLSNVNSLQCLDLGHANCAPTGNPTKTPSHAPTTAAPSTSEPTGAPTTKVPTGTPSESPTTGAPTTAQPTATPVTSSPTRDCRDECQDIFEFVENQHETLEVCVFCCTSPAHVCANRAVAAQNDADDHQFTTADISACRDCMCYTNVKAATQSCFFATEEAADAGVGAGNSGARSTYALPRYLSAAAVLVFAVLAALYCY